MTPPTLPRRFDARFFAAALPDDVEPSFEGDEVVAHAWHRPADALDAMADGRLAMWLPTSTTLQQLEHVGSIEEIRERLAPGPLGAIEVDELSPEVTRIVMPAGGGVAGQPVCAYLVGRRRFVLIDPGDPTGPALDRALEIAAARGGAIEAIALTHVDPDHAAGAEAVAERLGIPVLTGPGGGRPLPYEVRELADLELLDAGDVQLRAVLTPGSAAGPRCVPGHRRRIRPDRRPRWRARRPLDPGTRRPHRLGDLAGTPRRPRARRAPPARTSDRARSGLT